MFIPTIEGAAAPTASPAAQSLPPSAAPAASASEPVRHLLFGSLGAVQATIKHLHKLRYAEANHWSQPIPTGRANEMMTILTKKVR
ncbi:MAG: hypothetical protein WBC73_21580, partial [Phormidesmis sp.]